MANTTLYDAYNRPIKKAELTQEIAAPTLAGVRSIWNEGVASGLNTGRLAALLTAAAEGDHRAYLTLAEEIEEKDLHYGSVLGTRKRAVKRLPVSIEAASDSAEHKLHADACREMVKRAGFKGMLEDCMDGLGKGWGVNEIIWDTSESQWMPERYIWRDPRFFTTDQVTRSEIRLIDDADLANGIQLAPYKFIVHVPKLKSGIPIRGGLARPVAWAYLFKNFTIKDWMAFLEVFGMPLRLGKYPANAKPEEIDILKMAVANLGSDAAAVIPEGMLIELIERKVSGADEIFLRKVDFWDNQVAYLVLGQKATTGGTPGKLGNDEGKENVRNDIRDSDAEQLEETLQRDLIKPFIDLNFGPQKSYPLLRLFEPKPEDTGALVNALKELVPLGLKVEQSVIRDRLNIPDPSPTAKPEDLLGSAPLTNQPPALPVPERSRRVLNHEQTCPHCNSERAAATDAIDDLVADELQDWQQLMTPVVDPLRLALDEAIAKGETIQDFLTRLPQIMEGMDISKLTESLAIATLKARGLGDATDEV